MTGRLKNNILIGRGTMAVECLSILNKYAIKPKIIICDSEDTGEDTWTKSLLKAAKKAGYKEGINLFKERKVNNPDFIKKLISFGDIDIIFSIQPYALFKKPFISLAKDYIVNLHMAPLPKLRGMSPCAWAFLDGLTQMGVTLHLIQDEGIDNGPIIAQRLFPIKDSDNAWTLFNTCIKQGEKLFEEQVQNIINENIQPMPQNNDDMTYHSMHELDYKNMKVDLQKDIDSSWRFIRSRIFPPFQLPFFIYQNKKIYIQNVQKKDTKKHANIRVSKKNDGYHLYYKNGTLLIDKYNE